MRQSQSVLNINSNTFGKLPPRISLLTGFEYDFSGKTAFLYKAYISPYLGFIKQGDFYQINLGAILGYDPLQFGAAFRHTSLNSDAIILSFGYKLEKQFKFSYSYDITVSGIPSPSGGSHELSIAYTIEMIHESKYNDCFEIFR